MPLRVSRRDGLSVLRKPSQTVSLQSQKLRRRTVSMLVNREMRRFQINKRTVSRQGQNCAHPKCTHFMPVRVVRREKLSVPRKLSRTGSLQSQKLRRRRTNTPRTYTPHDGACSTSRRTVCAPDTLVNSITAKLSVEAKTSINLSQSREGEALCDEQYNIT